MRGDAFFVLDLFGKYSLFYHLSMLALGFPGGLAVKNPPAMQEMQEMQVRSLGGEDPLQEEMATHSSISAWIIPMGRGT